MRAVRLTFSLCVLAATAACGVGSGAGSLDEDGGPRGAAGDGGSDAGTVEKKQVELGTGADGFYPLTEGQTVQIIAGPQGGFHLWTAIRLRAPMNPKGATAHVQVLLNGESQSDNTWKLTFSPNGDAYDYFALTEILKDPNVVRGQLVEFRVDVTDAEGHTGSDSKHVIPQGP